MRGLALACVIAVTACSTIPAGRLEQSNEGGIDANELPDGELMVDGPSQSEDIDAEAVDATPPIDAPDDIDAPGPPDAPDDMDAPVPPDAAPRIDAHVIVPDAGIAVPDAGTTSCARQLLGNGDFDSTSGDGVDRNAGPWVIEDAENDPSVIVLTETELSGFGAPGPQSGNYAVRLGGDNDRVDIVYQVFDVPATATGITLSGYVNIITEDGVPQGDLLSLNLFDDAAGPQAPPIETLHTFANEDATDGWVYFSFPASSGYAGKTLVLAIQGSTDGIDVTNFFLDTIVFQATCQ